MSENPLLFEKKASYGSGSLSVVETTDGSGIAVRLIMTSGPSTVCASIILREAETSVLADSLFRWVKDKRAEGGFR